MTSPNYPWDGLHHQSYYLPQVAKPSLSSNQFAIKTKDFISFGHIDQFQNPVPTLDVFEQRNMANISPTIKIDISLKPSITENVIIEVSCSSTQITYLKHLFQQFQDMFPWSYAKITNLNLAIMEHQIDTWPNAPPIQQNKFPIHPTKDMDIKDEIYKLHQDEIIFSIKYTSWVSNPIHVTKKYGIVHVCTNL